MSAVQPFKAGTIFKKKSVVPCNPSKKSTNRKNQSLMNRSELSYGSNRSELKGR